MRILLNKIMDVSMHEPTHLDNSIYGNNDANTLIIDLLGKWFSNPSSTGKDIGFYRPPGVGKACFAKALGNALDIPITQINLGS